MAKPKVYELVNKTQFKHNKQSLIKACGLSKTHVKNKEKVIMEKLFHSDGKLPSKVIEEIVLDIRTGKDLVETIAILTTLLVSKR